MADKRFSIQIDVEGNLSPIKGTINELQKAFSHLNLPTHLQNSISQIFSKMGREIQNFEAMANKGFSNMGDVNKAEKSFGNILTLFEHLKIQAGQIKGIDPEKLVPKTTLDKIKEVSNAWDKLNSELNKKTKHQSDIENATKDYDKQIRKVQDLEAAQNKLKAAQEAINKSKQEKNAAIQQLEAEKKAIEDAINARKILKESGEKDTTKTGTSDLTRDLNEKIKEINRLKNELSGLNKMADVQAPKMAINQTELTAAIGKVDELKTKLETLKSTNVQMEGLETLRQQISDLTGIPIEQLTNDFGELRNILFGFRSDTIQKAAQEAINFAHNTENASDSARQMNKTLEETRQSAKGFMTAAEEVDHLRTRLAYFFSIGNSVQLFKRAIRSALNTVKELDAVMTETAVVTDFTVGDMWDKLPQYAAQANALGASIKDLYSATTLYYQQGLQTNAAMGVGVETMKMARIANMEAAEATQAMTAALRGFNMEVNEMNAQVVNDVYSELAAITAADTSQIATAMTKTASIASSANMEFETTAALLAQIIETTQEAPETAGTAMKTIIARFTEVKQLFSEGMLTGEDGEGEEININKIDAALKTVGISLKDFLTGSKGIDDIFLELASKWDTLDLATQRYIATTAAGSRQQSRFIAMMSNYDRTMELVGAAQNSAGASQEQFNKTLDSMEAKLQNLSNAWNQFLMGLANNEILKGGIDLLTNLLNTINNITDSLSGGNGLGKSLVSFMAIIGALKGGKALLGGAFRWMGTQMGMSPPTKAELQSQQLMGSKLFGDDPAKIAAIEGQKAGTSFSSSFQRAMVSAKAGRGFKASMKSFFTMDQIVDTKNWWTKEQFFDEANLINRGKNLAQVHEAYNTGGIDAANAKLKELGLQSVNTSQMMQTIPLNFQAIGMAAMGIGGILGMIANHFEEIGNTEAAEKISKVSTVLMGFGSVLTMVNMIIPGLGNAFSIAGGKIVAAGVASQAAWWWLLAIPAAIAGIAWAASAISKAAYNASAEGKLKKATEESEQAEEAAKNAAEGYNELKTALESLKEQEKTLETLTKGTTEWKEAVQSLNDEVLTLIENNPSLAPFVASKGGVLGLDYNKTVLNDKGQVTTVESILENEAKQSLVAQTISLQAQKNIDQTKASNYFLQEKQDRTTPEFGGVITATQMPKNILQKTWWDTFDKKADILENETNQLADLIASGQIKNYEEMQNYVKNLEVEGYGQAYVFHGMGREDETFLQLKQYGKLRQENEAKEQVQNRAISNNLIESADLTNSQKEIITALNPSVIMDGYNKILDQQKENYNKDNFEITDDAKELYADLVGYTYDRSTKRFYSGKGENRVDVTEQVSDDNIRTGLATERATEIYTIKLEQISSTLVGKTAEQQELILSTIGETGQMTSSILKEFGDWNAETGTFDFKQGENGEGFEALAKQMGFDSLQAYADAFGTDIETAKSTIIKSFERNGDAFVKRRKDLVHKMSKYSEDGAKGYEWNATQLAGLEAKFGEQFVDVLEGVFTSLELSGNEELISTGANVFKTIALAGTEQDTKKISDFIGEVNWGNSIEAAAALRKEIEYGTGAAKVYAKAMIDANLNYLSVGSQTQALFQSEQFGEISNELEEILDTSQEISATDVNDLAKSYKILDNYLKNTEITASGLARALTEIQKGNLTFDQLTTSVMFALSSFNSLDDTVADILGKLEEFDLGSDENQIAGKIGEFNEVLSGNLEKGAYGNSQNFKILDFMFGPNWDKTWNEETKQFDQLVGDDLTNRMKELNKQLGENANNMLTSWKQLANNQDIYGKAIELEGEYEISPTVKYENGEILLEDFEGMTTLELTSWIADAYNVSKEYAQMMLADFKNYSDDLAIELMQNDYLAGIDAAYENLSKIRSAVDMYASGAYVGQGDIWLKAIDKNEISAIATALGELPEKVQADFEAKGAIITNFYDEDGILKRGRELFDELNRLYSENGGKGQWEDKYFEESKLVYEGTPYAYYSNAKFDYEGFNKDLERYGFNGQQKVQITQDIIDQQIQSTGKPVDIDVKLSDGSMKTLTLQAGESFEEAYAQADLEQQNKNLGDAIAESLGTIEWKVDESSAASAQEIINTMREAAAEPIALTAKTDGVATAWNTWRDSIDTNIVMSASISPTSVSIGAEGGGSFTVSIAQLAKGIKNAPGSFDALTGEEGPELVQTGKGAYLVGQNGPEMAHINKGDTVYTADETKKILKGSKHKITPRFATGYGDATGSSGGSGGRSISDNEDYKTSIDKLYNLLRDIDEELRIREALERRYTKILEGLNTTAKALVEVSNKELAQLEKERGLNEQRIAGRQQQIQQYQQENSKYNKYAWSETDEHGNMVLRIDWAAINAISDEEEGKGVEEYLSQLEDWFGDIEEAEDNIIDIDEAVKEIKERGKDEYFDLESQIKEALENERQKEIDKLSEINESINDTNSRLLEAMQDSIEQQRQDRENEKTEEELADKQRRLAYLQQDTSGANALEIMQLQKEIEEGQEDYTDTLIDQKISELQKQNDEAAEQREKQIEILQAQLDNWVESGAIWQNVYDLMGSGIDENGMVIDGSALMNLLKTDSQYASMSNLEKLKWAEELNDTVAQALHWLQVGNQLENLEMEGQTVTFTATDSEGNEHTLTGTVNEDGSVTTSEGTTYEGVYRNYDGSYTTEEGWKDPSQVEAEVTEEEGAPSEPAKPEITEALKKGVSAAIWNGNQGWGSGSKRTSRLNQVFGESVANDIVKNYVNKKKYGGNPADYSYSKMMTAFGITEPAITGGSSNNTSGEREQVYYTGDEVAQYNKDNGTDMSNWVYDPLTGKWRKPIKYATGGLADFTGPAWLDGTKSKPEYVLNADQTRAFFTLVDVLESLRLGTSKSSENSGDTNYDIDINVESIGSDYDVEQMAGTIKRLINDDARYRNNNAVNLMR